MKKRCATLLVGSLLGLSMVQPSVTHASETATIQVTGTLDQQTETAERPHNQPEEPSLPEQQTIIKDRLPQTGEQKTALFTFLGCLFVAIVAVVLVKCRKK